MPYPTLARAKLLVLTCVALATIPVAHAASLPLQVAKLFSSVLSAVKLNTRVPILLPSVLPAGLKESEIHFAHGRGDANGYVISLFYDKGDGVVAGSFTGRAHQGPRSYGQKVSLAQGSTGDFQAGSCVTYCVPSQIDWWVNGVHYEVQARLKTRDVAEQRQTMIALANSAIAGGPR